MEVNTIILKVDGMDCANCAQGICRYLERKGKTDVFVDYATGEVRFKEQNSDFPLQKVKQGIHKMGYHVLEEGVAAPWWNLDKRLLISAILTIPLLLGHLLMVFGIHLPFVLNMWVGFFLTLPVYIIGIEYFGRSAWSSLQIRVPNMDVLIFLGSSAAFWYSVTGLVLNDSNLNFFETSATIITLVLLGNWFEKRAVEKTTTAIGELTELQAETAVYLNKENKWETIPKSRIRKHMKLQVRAGDKIPADGRIIEGEGLVDESMLTGESLPVERLYDDPVIGGSILQQGHFQMEVMAVGSDSVLAKMIDLVKRAQENKPQIQRLADRASAVSAAQQDRSL